MSIPKQLHLIWVGGKPLPPKYAAHIQQWVTRNPDFQICLWQDRVGTAAEALSATVHHLEQLDLTVSHNAEDKPQVLIKDITEAGVVSDMARYEIDRMRPNYGAASDILRYRILHMYGGMYVDTDVNPPESPLSDIQVEEGALFEGADVDFAVPVSSYVNDEGSCNNDILLSKPGSVCMQEINELVAENYQYLSFHEDAKQLSEDDICYFKYKWSSGSAVLQLLHAQRPAYILESTIAKAGPSLMSPILGSDNKPYVKVTQSLLREEELAFVNDASWYGIAPRAQATLDDALICVFGEIVFELEHTGVLRLDDHLVNIQESLAWSDDELLEKEEVVLEKIIGLLNDWNSEWQDKIKISQMTFKFDAVEKFHHESALLEKAMLLPVNGMPVDDVTFLINYFRQPYSHMHQAAQYHGVLDRQAIQHKFNDVQSRYKGLSGLANFYSCELKSGVYTSDEIRDIKQCAQVLQQCLSELNSDLESDMYKIQSVASGLGDLGKEILVKFQELSADIAQFCESEVFAALKPSVSVARSGLFSMTTAPEQQSLEVAAKSQWSDWCNLV
jgi:hypothetical protein